jgi:hypothetical protein
VSSAHSSPSRKPAHEDDRGIAGQISAENGSNWTVVDRAGKQFTVDITPQTQFGTKHRPATEAEFTVGSEVRVSGPINGTTITATRVMAPLPKSSATLSAVPTTTTQTTG